MVVEVARNSSACSDSSNTDGAILDLSKLEIIKITEEAKSLLGIDNENTHLEAADEMEHWQGFTNKSYIIKKVINNSGKKMFSRVGMLRVNSIIPDFLINRERELSLIELTKTTDIGPELLFVFKNGFCTRYINGIPIPMNVFSHPDCLCLIAEMLAKFNALTMTKSLGTNELISKWKYYLDSLDCNNLILGSETISLKEMKEIFEFSSEIDRIGITNRSQFECIIHGDSNSTNLIFSGLSCFHNISEMSKITIEDVLNPLTKITLFDYELTAKCPFIYEIASLIYLSASFPRDFDLLASNETISRIIDTYFGEMENQGFSELKPSNLMYFKAQLNLAILNFCLFTLLNMYRINQVNDLSQYLGAELKFFRKMYRKLFGNLSYKEAIQSVENYSFLEFIS